MKIFGFLGLIVLLGSAIGCIPQVDDSVTLSFWTDRELFEDGFKMVFVNDRYIGDLGNDLKNPICNDSTLLNYQMKKSEDLLVTIHNAQEASIEIGIVNLYSVSQGIKIKPSKDADIFVNRDLDDECTLVYLNWK